VPDFFRFGIKKLGLKVLELGVQINLLEGVQSVVVVNHNNKSTVMLIRRIDMNRILSGAIKTFLVFTVFLVNGFDAYGKDKACWVDFFEHSQYSGKHFLLEGPVQLPSLDNVNGENWDLRIGSLSVGPKARVIVYENPNFKLTLTEMAKYPDLMHSLGVTEKDIKEDAELIFKADSKIHDLSDFNFNQKIRSVKVECNE